VAKNLILDLDGSPLDFPVRRILVAGYTGRDTTQVRAHIAELAKQGIPPPDRVPVLFPLDDFWATTDTRLEFSLAHVSGEVEPALLFLGDRLEDALVSVIVDFTDRDEERRSIERSKRLPKPLSRNVWRYRDVADVWDQVAMRSWAEPGPGRDLYQSGTLAQLLAPPDLLASLHLTPPLDGSLLLMGTLPLRRKEFAFTDYFACELETPDRRKLSYECNLVQR
jgi:4-hydroxyphenylacetate 3-monooxygenase